MREEERGKGVVVQRGRDLGGVGDAVIKLPGHQPRRADRRRRDLIGRHFTDKGAVAEVPGRRTLDTRVEEEKGSEHSPAQQEPQRPARRRRRRGRGRPLVQLVYPVRRTRPGRGRPVGGTHALMKSVERKIASIPVSALGNSETSHRGPGQLGKIVVRVHGRKTFSERPPGRCTFGATADAAMAFACGPSPL